MTLAVAHVAFLASFTVANTGFPKWTVPPFFGEVPPTSWVQYSRAFSPWNVACFPVKPTKKILLTLISN